MSADEAPPAAIPKAGDVVVLSSVAVYYDAELGPLEVAGRVLHPMLALLASRRGEGLTVSTASEHITPMGKVALQTNIKRLRDTLSAASIGGRGPYYFIPAVGSVDLVDFEAAAERVDASPTIAGAKAALALWTGELPTDAGSAPIFQNALRLRARLREIVETKIKRVLIVEDKIGPELERLLKTKYPGVLEVELADSEEKVDAIASRIDDFDLVLLDFHLSERDDKFSGFEVAELIKGRKKVTPVLGMSYRRPERSNDEDLSIRLDLWGFVSKNVADDLGAVKLIVNAALALLAMDDDDRIGHYAKMIPRLRMLARARAMAGYKTHSASEIPEEIRALETAVKAKNVRELRTKVLAFYRDRCEAET